MDIGALIEAIGTSVSKAQQRIEQHSIERFFDYFSESGVKSASNDLSETQPNFKPVTTKVVMPCSSDISKTETVDVPLVALASHRQVHLDKITVKVRTRLTADNSCISADINAPSNDSNYPGKTDGENADRMDEIELVFNVSESSEGVSRVVDNISKTI